MEETGKRRELTGMRKQVSELNADFFQLLYDLKENKEALGKPQFYELMLNNMSDLYKREYLRIYVDYDLEVKREMFEKKMKIASLDPHAWRFLFFHYENIPAKLIIEDANIEAEKFFKECEAKNDAARPDYMPKLYLTRADKRAAKKAEKRAEKERKKRGQMFNEEAMQPPEAVPPTALISDAETKKQECLRALEESRKKKKEQEGAATSENSPKSGT